MRESEQKVNATQKPKAKLSPHVRCNSSGIHRDANKPVTYILPGAFRCCRGCFIDVSGARKITDAGESDLLLSNYGLKIKGQIRKEEQYCSNIFEDNVKKNFKL